MPCYLYRNPKTGKVVEVIQRMCEPHIYSEDGVEFERQFTVPTASVDAALDPWNKNQFLSKTSKPDSMGALFDRSRELSEKRAAQSITGTDPIKDQTLKDYSKKRKGRKHVSRISPGELSLSLG